MSNQIVRLVGTFTGSERNELLFHYPESGEWWLGYFSNNQLHWQLANNSSGFGNVTDGRPFWTGNFTGSGRTDLLFFSPVDKHWWLGYFTGTQLQWNLANSPDQPDSR